MDDFVILAKTRWKLRKAVAVMNQTLNDLCLEKHPDKTYIGKTEKGFDFLGYHITPTSVSLSKKTIENFLCKISRLYEQGASDERIGRYKERFWGWVRGGVGDEDFLIKKYARDW